MKKVWSKRPSPAMIVALVALFAALGGSAYAAKKIGTKEIKANAITTGKIKKNAITTSKIKKEAVTGAKIKESSLGAVPNATHATSADSATNATNATNWSRYYTSGLKKANLGQTVALGSIGPFAIEGVCTDGGSDEYQAQVRISTNANGSFLYSEESSYYEGDFDPGDPGYLTEVVESTGPYWLGYYGYYNEWHAVSPDGSQILQGFANAGVHAFGSPCAFQVSWVNEA
ncbi:MAG TPA: hypothetical protein VFU16_10445 [Solirubrobacterales bacterium]|nr:hypothetical protein [Solirubrobacterales bacterium]